MVQTWLDSIADGSVPSTSVKPIGVNTGATMSSNYNLEVMRVDD